MSLVRNIGSVAMTDAEKIMLAIQDSGGGSVAPQPTDITFTSPMPAATASMPVVPAPAAVQQEQNNKFILLAALGVAAVYLLSKRRG
jgi:hypothetical protein